MYCCPAPPPPRPGRVRACAHRLQCSVSAAVGDPVALVPGEGLDGQHVAQKHVFLHCRRSPDRVRCVHVRRLGRAPPPCPRAHSCVRCPARRTVRRNKIKPFSLPDYASHNAGLSPASLFFSHVSSHTHTHAHPQSLVIRDQESFGWDLEFRVRRIT